MTYTVYLHSNSGGTPHMEFIHATELEKAKVIARKMLDQHANADKAELWEGDDCLITVIAHSRAAGR